MSTAELSPTWLSLVPLLNETQARLYCAEKAISIGHGGLSRVHEATGLSMATIRKGVRELRNPKTLPPADRVRRAGGGRKPVESIDATLRRDLELILAESTAGDPMCPLKWTGKSIRKITTELSRHGHQVSFRTICRLLHSLGYSLQVNQKTKEGSDHPDRDSQFRYIASQVKKAIAAGQPVISIDTKKKERVGNFKNAGQTWRSKGDPREVNVYDYPNLGIGVAIPHGTYDIQRNEGMVTVGISHDTGEFAVESIRQWWRRLGRRHYPNATRLLICADGGGSNGSRRRDWKLHLQEFASETGIDVTVCHYPPGTSKWNKIEHRMFSFISIQWKGQPLDSYETVINLIGSTTTATGLKVKARLDKSTYETGRKVSDDELAQVNLQPHGRHPHWNYTIKGGA